MLKHTRPQAFAGTRRDTDTLQLHVHGIQCDIVRGDETALALEDDGNLLRCWGLPSTLVDRFDARLLLDSPLGDSAPVHERTLSDIELDGERYADTLAARADFASSSDTSPSPDLMAPCQHPISTGAAVPFEYGATLSDSSRVEEPQAPSVPEPGNDDPAFQPTGRVPGNLRLAGVAPTTLRHLKVMLQAARAVRGGGPQLEILMRVRHARQPLFGFLQPEDARHAFFKWLTGLPEEDTGVEALHVAQDLSPGPDTASSLLRVMQRLAASVQEHGPAFERRVAGLMGTTGTFSFLDPAHRDHKHYRRLVGETGELDEAEAPGTTMPLHQPLVAAEPVHPPTEGSAPGPSAAAALDVPPWLVGRQQGPTAAIPQPPKAGEPAERPLYIDPASELEVFGGEAEAAGPVQRHEAQLQARRRKARELLAQQHALQ
ncbi:hypothetical protein ACKKBG_A09850 [Auxenochlorella protothecoides x Auxenochlorella symbiontica]